MSEEAVELVRVDVVDTRGVSVLLDHLLAARGGHAAGPSKP
ncbi:hypothetical protein [Nocardia sp. NPDC051833]